MCRKYRRSVMESTSCTSPHGSRPPPTHHRTRGKRPPHGEYNRISSRCTSTSPGRSQRWNTRCGTHYGGIIIRNSRNSSSTILLLYHHHHPSRRSPRNAKSLPRDESQHPPLKPEESSSPPPPHPPQQRGCQPRQSWEGPVTKQVTNHCGLHRWMVYRLRRKVPLSRQPPSPHGRRRHTSHNGQ